MNLYVIHWLVENMNLDVIHVHNIVSVKKIEKRYNKDIILIRLHTTRTLFKIMCLYSKLFHVFLISIPLLKVQYQEYLY
jgi:hypothetical protein